MESARARTDNMEPPAFQDLLHQCQGGMFPRHRAKKCLWLSAMPCFFDPAIKLNTDVQRLAPGASTEVETMLLPLPGVHQSLSCSESPPLDSPLAMLRVTPFVILAFLTVTAAAPRMFPCHASSSKPSLAMLAIAAALKSPCHACSHCSCAKQSC